MANCTSAPPPLIRFSRSGNLELKGVRLRVAHTLCGTCNSQLCIILVHGEKLFAYGRRQNVENRGLVGISRSGGGGDGR